MAGGVAAVVLCAAAVAHQGTKAYQSFHLATHSVRGDLEVAALAILGLASRLAVGAVGTAVVEVATAVAISASLTGRIEAIDGATATRGTDLLLGAWYELKSIGYVSVSDRSVPNVDLDVSCLETYNESPQIVDDTQTQNCEIKV